MKINSQSQGEIRNALKKAVEHYLSGNDESITDFYVHVAIDSGDLSVYDDEDNTLAAATIGEWADHKDEDDEDLLTEIVSNLRDELKKMADEHLFDAVKVMKPFSFVLVDDDKETLEELYLVDDDTMMIGGDLLEGLDDDLNNFMNELLK